MSETILNGMRANRVYLFACIASVLLTLWVGYRGTLINPDGICYVLSAELLGEAPLKQVLHLCPQSQWPFYSGLIFAFANLMHVSYLTAAYTVDGIFSLASILLFIHIVKTLGGRGRVLWLAALLMLGNHHFNILRETIIRDHGFWAFYLGSVYFLLRTFQEPRWSNALAWNVCLLMATLFRIEGVIFLLAMPWLAWFDFRRAWSIRAKLFLKLVLPLFLMGAVALLWLLTHPELAAGKLGRFNEIIQQFEHGFSIILNRYTTAKAGLLQHVLSPESTSDASVVLICLWILWYLYNVIISLSWGYTALLGYAWIKRMMIWPAHTRLVIHGYIAVNVVITLAFLAEHLFISKRYLVALTLLLMVWLPFALDYLITQWKDMRQRVLLILLSTMMILSAISGVVDFGHSKSYIRKAGEWMATNIPADASLYMNDFQLMYYSKHYGFRIFEVLPVYMHLQAIENEKWKQFDYLGLRYHNEDAGEMAKIKNEMGGLTPIKVFGNKRGNQIAIYKISSKNE